MPLLPGPSQIQPGGDAILNPPPTGPGQIPVSTDTSHASWEDAAVAATTPPNPDTLNGSSVPDGTYSPGPHSHPLADLYDRFGLDSVNVVAASGATETIPDPSVYQVSFIKLTANCALTLPAVGVGKRFELYLTQDATGSRVPSFPANVAWVGGVAPAWSTAANLTDHVLFRCVDGNNWHADVGAIGVVTPPPPISIIQSVALPAGAGGVTTMTLPADVGINNSLLLVLGVIEGNEPANPSGGGVTWQQVGRLASPAAPTVVTVGVAGATSYKYAISYVNAIGETSVSAVTTITTGNATLTGSNKNRVSWPAAPTDAVSVRVYGRSGATLGLLATVAVGTTQWDDDGSVSPGAAVPGFNDSGDLPPFGTSSVINRVEVWLGTASTGGGGTATINFAASINGHVFELGGGSLEGSAVPRTGSGNATSGAPWSAPTMTSPRNGDMVAVVFGSDSGGTPPAGAWTVQAAWNARDNLLSTQVFIAYQLSTVNGNNYASAWTGIDGVPRPVSALAFFIRQ